MIEPLDTPWLEEHLLVPEHEAKQWAERVLALRRSWTPRNPNAPFFTLGMAAYLDAIHAEAELGHRTAYHARALLSFNNRLLEREFAPLLEACRLHLSHWSGLVAAYEPSRSALPGFHIHLPHQAFSSGVASTHNDLQFQQVFPKAQPTAAEVLTFTVPLSLPPGSGLNLWDGERVQFHSYQVGHVYLHSGLHKHQAVLHPQGGQTPRICLQGHGLISDNRLILYW